MRASKPQARRSSHGAHAASRPRPLDAQLEVRAAADTVWRVVSDVRRTGEWSPECRRVVPLGRVRAGTFMVGFNRRGSIRWATLSRVTRFEPGREIEWKVMTNRAVWSYRIDATTTATLLTHTRRTPRGEGRFALLFTRLFLGGQGEHDDELERGMRDGLERIATIVAEEAGARAHLASQPAAGAGRPVDSAVHGHQD